jgi:hypothetical protein
MDDDERRALLGVLYGRELSNDKANELLNSERPKATETKYLEEEAERVLVTRMRANTDFALSSYRLGTLLFPQEDALNKPKRRAAISCMASNARSSTMMTLSMLEFSRASRKNPASNDVLEALQKRIRNVINNLTDHYDSAYAQNWIRYHRHLNKLREEEDSAGE